MPDGRLRRAADNTAPQPSAAAPPQQQGIAAADSPAKAPVAEQAPRLWGERHATAGAFGCAVNVSEDGTSYSGCKSYSETLVELKRRADEVSLPYKWWLMDSWWYQARRHPSTSITATSPTPTPTCTATRRAA